MKHSTFKFSKIGKIVIASILALLLMPSASVAQEKEERKKSQIVYKYNQFVMVTLKDGSEVPGRVSSVKSKNQYYVRMIGGNKNGLVNKKYIRAMTREEIDEIRLQAKARASN